MIRSQYNRNISSALYRCMAFVVLMLTFALGAKAQNVWVLEETHATGIENGVVYLNDLEDHTWTYYIWQHNRQHMYSLGY